VTLKLHFTENGIRRAVAGARKAGLKPNAVTIAPDGTITVYEGLKPPPSKKPPKSRWEDPKSEWADLS
jgi:hypothetical protein